MSATTGWNTHIKMVWCWLATLLRPPIQRLDRGFRSLCVLLECYATNFRTIPIGMRQDTATQSTISGVFKHVTGWRNGSALKGGGTGDQISSTENGWRSGIACHTIDRKNAAAVCLASSKF